MGEDHGRHGVTHPPVDTAGDPEPPTPAERMLATRNGLLRALRRLEQVKATARSTRPPQGEERRVLPASHFLGLEVETDLERLAEELERSVEDLATLL